MPSKEFLGNVSEHSQSSNREPVRSQRQVVQEVDIRNPISDDESDSEIFRVKRRSSTKVEKKIVQDSASVNTGQQVQHFICESLDVKFSIYTTVHKSAPTSLKKKLEETCFCKNKIITLFMRKIKV